MKKLIAFIAALVMIFMLSLTAEAANLGESGLVSLTTEDRTIVIKKDIIAYNPAESDVHAPAISYSYTIASGSSGKNVKDANGISTTTLAGPEGATITDSLTWTASETLQTASGGKANTKTITADFSGVTFPSAGVYRYKITETATYTNTGVTDENSHTRYLDVYVKNAATAGTFEIYGYVLFTNDNNIDGSTTAADEDKATAAAKTEGFVGDTADKYYTYNLSVSKTLSGDNGMNGNEFPFSISFTGTETSVLPIISKEGTATIPAQWTTAGTMSSFNMTADSNKLKIANGGVVTVTGIPIGTSVQINEKNNVTGTTYQVASSGADANAESKPVSPNEVSNTASVNAQTTDKDIVDKNVVFTNTLALISPTGYIARYAPYALMLIGGIVLLVVAMKHKKHTDEE